MRQLGKEADAAVLSSFSDVHPGAQVTIPDAQLLFHSEFKRTGPDLTLIGEDGHRLVVIDYFRQEHPAALMSPDGATLSGDVVAALAGPANPGKYAGSAPSAAKAIGHVAQAEGAVTAVRNGVAIALNSGDAVLQGDVLQTGSDGVLGVVFNDGSVFKINAGSRLVLSEFSYTPNGGANTEMFELVQGSFTFVSGDVAKTGQMRIGTPASVMKVVGTTGGGDVSSANGQVTLYLFPHNDGTHTALVFDRNGNPLATLSSEGGKYVITPIGPQQVTGAELPKTDADKLFALDALASILKVKSFADQITDSIPTQTPTSGSHGSSSPPSEIFPGLGSAASTPFTIVIPPATNVLPAQTAPGVQTGPDVTPPHDPPQQRSGPRAPLGSDDTYTLNEDGILIVAASGVLANDTDPDGGPLSASLVAGPQHGVLTFNSDGSFSYVPVSNYNGLDSFTYAAGDGALNSGNVTVHLTVTPVNDAPVSAGIALAAVDEAVAAHSRVFTAAATDPDGDTLTYSLVPGGDAAAFTIDAATGIVTINAIPDFETKSAYSFSVKASDASGSFSTQAVTLGVNDLAPAISSGTAAAVNEGVAPNTAVYTAAAADPAGGLVTYSLVVGGDASAFTIDAATGVVTINASSDFETKPSYSFSVKASDASGSFTTQAVTLSVNDLAPVISSGAAASVNEGVAANAAVYTAAAADPAGGAVTYSLIAGGDASALSIDSSTGVVTLNNTPDFETKPSYSFTVKASDASGTFTTQAVTLGVNDLAPVIGSGTTANVNEAVAANTAVYTATAADPAGGAVTYALTGTDASAFTIDASTGVVTINASPDFETKPSYSFSVKASDASGTFTTQAVTLGVNDLAPVIGSGTTANVNEAVAANTIVYTAAATDPAGGAVSYALTGADASAFTINASTGIVTINASPDFETKNSYSFSVKASDASGAFTTQAVTLSVNDLAPVISSGVTANVNEAVAANTAVYTAAAADPAGGAVTYSLIAGGDASAFTIDASTGVVTINATPDFETKPSYGFTIKASDASGASSTQAVTLGVNDLPPVIGSGTTASINENVAANTVVYTAAAADPAGGAVSYALTGADASAFTINASTGVVTIDNTPHFATKSSYSFSVKASDASGLFTTQAVTLSISLNQPPAISGDLSVALYQGGKVVLTPADLAAADVDNSSSQLTFNVTGTTRGHVALASAPATTITSFTQAQLAAGLVAFVSDGTANATASFTVTATDGAVTTAPSTVNAAVSVVPDPLNITSNTTIDIHDANATISTFHQSFYSTLTGTGTLIVTGSATLADASTQSGSGTTIFRTDTTASSLYNLTIDGRSLEFESVSASNPVDLTFTGTGGSNTTMLLNNGASLRFSSAVIGNAVVGSTLKVLQNKITIGTTLGALGSVVFEDNSSLRLETFASLALNVGSVVFENNATWDLGQGASVVFNAPVSAVAHADFGRWRIGSGDVGSSVTFTHGLDLTPDLSGFTYQTDPSGRPAWYNSSEHVYWYGSWNYGYTGNPSIALNYAVSGVPNVTIVGDDFVPLRAAHVTFVNSTVANDWQAIEKLTLINSSMVGGHHIEFVATKSYEVLGGTVVTFYLSSGYDFYYYDLPGNVSKLRVDDGTVFLNHQSGTVPAFRGGLDIDHNATIDATDIPIPYAAPTITLGAGSVSNWGQAVTPSRMNFTLDHLVVTTGNVGYADIHAYYGTINLNNRSQIVLTYFGRFDDGVGFGGDGLTIQSTAGSGSVINGGQWILRSSTGSGMHVNVEFSTIGDGSVWLLNSQSKLTLAGGGTDVNAHYLGVGTVLFAGGTRTIDSGSDISTAKVVFSGGTTTLDGSYGVSPLDGSYVSSTTVSGGAANLLGASTSLGAVTISGGTLNLGGGVETALSLTQSGGTLTGTGTLTVSGAAAFSGGTESGSGTTIVNGAATFFTSSNQTLTLDTGRVIDLKGSAQTGAFSGETIHLNGAAQLIVDTGVTFTDRGTGSGAIGFTIDGNGTLKVFGSYAKTGIGTTDISAAVVNSGTIDVQAGTMTLSGAVTGTGTVTIGPDGTVAFGASVGADQTIVFSATTGWLTLNAPALFEGTISGFFGTAPDAAHSDVIELVGIDFNSFVHNYDPLTGILSVTDGADSATLKFAGFNRTFRFAADADGDTLIFDPPAAPTAAEPALPPVATGAADGTNAAPNQTGPVWAGTAGSDSFVFKPGIGAGTILNFDSAHDSIEFDNFADVHAVEQLVSAITSDFHGNVVIGLGHGDSITIAGMTASQFQAIAQSAIHLH